MSRNFSQPDTAPFKPPKIQPKALEYMQIQQANEEFQRLPVNINTLMFSSSEISRCFYSDLYNTNQGAASLKYKQRLLIYYLYFTCLVLANFAVNISMFQTGVTVKLEFTLQLVGPLLLLIAGYLILYRLLTCEKTRMLSHILLTALTVLTNFYLTFSDRRVSSNVFGSDFDNEYADNSISIAGLVVVNQYSLFSNFVLNLVQVICTLLFRACIIFPLSAKSLSSTSYDFVTLLIFCIMILLIAHSLDLKCKQRFWRVHNKEFALAELPENASEPVSECRTNNLASLINDIDEVKDGIKETARMIIFKDVRGRLRQLIKSLEGIKSAIYKRVSTEGMMNQSIGQIEDVSNEFIDDHFGSKSLSQYIEEKQPSKIFDNPEPVLSIGIQEIESMLFSVGRNWNFDIWPVYIATERSVSLLGKYLSYKWEFSSIAKCKDEDFEDFFIRLENGYLKNPYHNACHAADVMNSVLYFILCSPKLKEVVDVHDMLSVTIAVLGHDVGHPGLTNRFLVNTKDPLALRYNDHSVLENMHTSIIFDLITSGKVNILGNFDDSNWTRIRKSIIDMVLATDLSKHFEILTVFKARAFNLNDINLALLEDRLLVLKMCLKCGDIGHSAKTLSLHEKWTLLVSEEFFNQGDIEKSRGMAVSIFCDRNSTYLPKAQAGFIKSICTPLFKNLGQFLNSEAYNISVLKSLKFNRLHWESQDTSKRRRSMISSNFLLTDSLQGLRKAISDREMNDIGIKSFLTFL